MFSQIKPNHFYTYIILNFLFIKSIDRYIMYHFLYFLFTLETFLARLNSKSAMSRYTRLVNYYSTIWKVLHSRMYTCACMRVSNVNWPHIHSCVQLSRDQRVFLSTLRLIERTVNLHGQYPCSSTSRNARYRAFVD